MPFLKVKGKNIYKLKIKFNQTFSQHWSETFSVDGYKAQVLASHSKSTNKYRFFLSFYNLSICPVFYTFSILDLEGRAFITSKGELLKDGDRAERMISIIEVSSLKACNLIENDTFTVLVSVDRQLDVQEGSNPTKEESSNVADVTTNTIDLITKDSSTNTDGEDIHFLQTLSNDFSTFYENKTDTDCVLRVNDAQFQVHRAVLSARSSVFSAMFHHDTAESRSGEINIPDVKATVLGDVLYYVYSGKIRGLTANTASPMYTVADKYDLPALRTECFEFIKRNLTLDNFCDVALLAHTHGEMELEERVVMFIEENSDEVFESNMWQKFLKEKPLIASKVLMSGFKVSKKKQIRDTASK